MIQAVYQALQICVPLGTCSSGPIYQGNARKHTHSALHRSGQLNDHPADIGIMNFGSPLDSVACCLMLVAGRPISQRILTAFQLQLSQTRPVTSFALTLTHNALHTQA